MNEWMTDLIVAAPAAAAVIVVVMLFLKHLKEERKSRDESQSKMLTTIDKLSEPINELVTEVRLLREQSRKANAVK